VTLTLPIDEQANALLQRSPLALLIGMVLDHYNDECMFVVWERSWYSERTGTTWRA
jgi:hypothetical protein